MDKNICIYARIWKNYNHSFQKIFKNLNLFHDLKLFTRNFLTKFPYIPGITGKSFSNGSLPHQGFQWVLFEY